MGRASDRGAKWKQMKAVEISILHASTEPGTPLVSQVVMKPNDENEFNMNEKVYASPSGHTPLRYGQNDEIQKGIDIASVAFGRVLTNTIQQPIQAPINFSADDTPRPEARSPISFIAPKTARDYTLSAPRTTRGNKWNGARPAAAARKQSEPPPFPSKAYHSSTDSSSGVESEPFRGVKEMKAIWEKKNERTAESPKPPETPTKVTSTLLL